MAQRPSLQELATRVGILPEYTDCSGSVQTTTDSTREALLEAMGLDAGDEAAAASTRADLERQQREQVVEAVRVVTHNEPANASIGVHLPETDARSVDWLVELHTEDGQVEKSQGVADATPAGELQLALPRAPGVGYHTIRVSVRASGFEQKGEQSFIVTPAQCLTPREINADQQLFGLWTNLYTIRSARNWGVGDLTDLQELITWASGEGASFVGLNPLHKHRNRGKDISPYRPVSRFYRNELYVDVTVVPELNECSEAQAMLDAPDLSTRLQDLRNTDHVDYECISKLKRRILEVLHQNFVQRHRHRATDRGLAYAEYMARQGITLQHLATFLALEEHLERTGRSSDGWTSWPGGYRDPHSADVQAFQRQHELDIDFHCYVQFELDRQLAGAARHARDAGMTLGLYQDLALGTAPNGCEPWAYPDLFITGVSVGAPPDPLGPQGQDWALPALHPLRLAESGYWYWIQLLRAALAHAGAVRIDHVMGLLRQYWIPHGHPSSAGAYVSYPAEDLFGILALESRRHGALIVGEDLGTVPPGFSELLKKWGVLSNQVFHFQRDHSGGFLPPEQYSDRALVTANTHDLAPLASYWEGHDITLRRAVGQFSAEQSARAQAQRDQDRQALRSCLAEQRLLDGTQVPSTAELCGAMHSFLRRTPAPLVGLSLDDIVGETQPVNLPGVQPAEYASWSRRMRVPLEDLPAHTPKLGSATQR